MKLKLDGIKDLLDLGDFGKSRFLLDFAWNCMKLDGIKDLPDLGDFGKPRFLLDFV